MARRAAERMPEIRRIILFGSLITGIPTPRSDADLLVEVQHSPHSDPRDRIADVFRALAPHICPLDLFVYTMKEIDELAAARSPLVTEALRAGVDLLV